MWVTSFDDGTVTRLDAATGTRRGAPIRVGSHPRGVAAGGGAAWVANSGDGTVTRLGDGRTVPVGKDPRDLVRRRRLRVGGQRRRRHRDADRRRLGQGSGDPIAVGDDPIGIAVGGGAVWTANFRDGTVTPDSTVGSCRGAAQLSAQRRVSPGS